ncbi:MAG: malto-oligosyltrehalose trehalohydrolase [Nitrospiraceae bacterium]|nr:MAG: malto-oligosyltrehalose trehalohydrolase [Nitrospiraceae bacterium]
MDWSGPWELDLGARLLSPDRVHFRVWAPRAKAVAVRLIGRDSRPIPLEPRELGYFEATVAGAGDGDRYRYVLNDEQERPDPASRFQPDGVHGPSAVVDPGAFRWTDQGWRGLTKDQLVIYELHVGTFTREGTFPAVIPLLDYLRHDVGITAIELMPIAQFPGTRNWGYDGAYLFAPQASYGGPSGLRTLVDACHAQGLGVILDVVYNHLGPEGNYLGDFGPYFTDRYRTPWGAAINYDGPDSDEVRRYIIGNALYWITEYHIDGLRLDAVHGIYDFGARHILRELTDAVHAQADRLGRTVLVMAESDLNDVRVIAPPEEGGYGLDAQWNDDFHHALHALLTGERDGYYQDFGRLDQLATAIQDGFVYTGQRSAYRRRRHGSVSRGHPPSRFVVFAQNHDQVGNRARGDRLSMLLPFDALKVAAAAVLLAPNIPLLFMGEEYGERAPFLYFTDHGDPALVEAVRRGRKAEFVAFGWSGDIPDPQDPATFDRSRVHPGEPTDPQQAALLRWYRRLLGLRRSVAALAVSESGEAGHRVRSDDAQQIVTLHRWAADGSAALIVLGFNKGPASFSLRPPPGTWRMSLCSEAEEFGGSGDDQWPRALAPENGEAAVRLSAYTAAVYLKSNAC